MRTTNKAPPQSSGPGSRRLGSGRRPERGVRSYRRPTRSWRPFFEDLESGGVDVPRRAAIANWPGARFRELGVRTLQERRHGSCRVMAEATIRAPLGAKGDTPFEVWLDVIRWSAALAVVCTHVNNRFLIKYTLLDADRRHFVHLIIAFIAGFGHQAVVAFFVISGLLVGGSLWNENQRSPRLDLGAYFVKRLVRLWTVLIPCAVPDRRGGLDRPRRVSRRPRVRDRRYRRQRRRTGRDGISL